MIKEKYSVANIAVSSPFPPFSVLVSLILLFPLFLFQLIFNPLPLFPAFLFVFRSFKIHFIGQY